MEGKAKKDEAASLGPGRKESFMVVEEVIETKEMLAPLQDNDYEDIDYEEISSPQLVTCGMLIIRATGSNEIDESDKIEIENQKEDIRSIKGKEIKHLEEKKKNLKIDQMPEKFKTLERNAESETKNANSLKNKILEMNENQEEELNLETECKLAALHEPVKNKQTNLTALEDARVQESSSLHPLYPDFSVSVLRFQDAIESFSQAVFNDAFESMLGNIQSTESDITNVKKSTSKSSDSCDDNQYKNQKIVEESPLLNTTVSNKLTELKGNSSSVIEPEMLEIVEEPIMAEVAYTVGTKQKPVPSKIEDARSSPKYKPTEGDDKSKHFEEEPFTNTNVNKSLSEDEYGQDSSFIKPEIQEVIEEPVMLKVANSVGTKQEKLLSKTKDKSSNLENKQTENKSKLCEDEPLLNTTINNKLSELKGKASNFIEPNKQEVMEEPIEAVVAYKVGTRKEPQKSSEVSENSSYETHSDDLENFNPDKDYEPADDSKQKEENLQSFITKESVHDKKSLKVTESGTEKLISNLDNGSRNIGNLPQIIPGYRVKDHDETFDKMSENLQETPNIDASAGLKNTCEIVKNNETFKNQKEVSCETPPKDRIQSIPDICITPDTSDITEDDKDNVFIREADLTNNNSSAAPRTHDINANPIFPESDSEGWVTIPILRGFSDSEAYTNIAMSIQELSDNEGYEESNNNSPIIQEGDDFKKIKKSSVPSSQTVEFEDVSEPDSKVLSSKNTSEPCANNHTAESSIIHLAFSRDNDLQLEENVEELSTNITILKEHAKVDDTISGLETPVMLHEESLQYDQRITETCNLRVEKDKSAGNCISIRKENNFEDHESSGIKQDRTIKIAKDLLKIKEPESQKAESKMIQIDVKLENSSEELETKVTNLDEYASVNDTISGLETPVILHEESLKYEKSETEICDTQNKEESSLEFNIPVSEEKESEEPSGLNKNQDQIFVIAEDIYASRDTRLHQKVLLENEREKKLHEKENASETQKNVTSEVTEKAVEITEPIKDIEVVSEDKKITENAENKKQEVSYSTSNSKASEHQSLKQSSEKINVYKSENSITAENIVRDKTSFQHKPGSTNGTEQLSPGTVSIWLRRFSLIMLAGAVVCFYLTPSYDENSCDKNEKGVPASCALDGYAWLSRL